MFQIQLFTDKLNIIDLKILYSRLNLIGTQKHQLNLKTI